MSTPVDILQAAAAANMITLVRDAARYHWLRDSKNEKAAVAIFTSNADKWLDAEVDKAMAEESKRIAERAA